MSKPNVQKSRPESVSKQRLRLWLKLLKTSRHVEAGVREKLRTEFTTTLPRFDVMAALDRNDKGLRMSELSGALRVSNGNVTGIIDRLVQDGSVVRVPVPGDRRAMLVRLTQKGSEEFAAMAQEHESWISNVFSKLSSDECDQLIELLDDADIPLVEQKEDV